MSPINQKNLKGLIQREIVQKIGGTWWFATSQFHIVYTFKFHHTKGTMEISYKGCCI